MVPINTAFWGMVFLFGMIGALRGWAREVLVTFSVLLALFIQQIFGQFIFKGESAYIPVLLSVSDVVAPATYTQTQFFLCVALLLLMTFFGYASPTLASRIIGKKVIRERVQEAVLGFVVGLINGYLIAGMVWFYLDKVDYGMFGIQAPPEGTTAWTIATTYLPPNWLTAPLLYVAVALAFVFVIIVFV